MFGQDQSLEQNLFSDALKSFVERDRPLSAVRAAVDEGAAPAAGYSRQLAELGGFAAFVGEDRGGGSPSDDPIGDAAIASEIKGARLQPWPLASVHAAAALLASSESAERGAELEELLAGERLSAVPVAGDASWGTASVSVTRAGEGYVLDGSVITDVQDGAARLVLALEHDQEPLVLSVPSGGSGVTREPLHTLDLSVALTRVRFDGTRCAPSQVVPVTTGQVDRARALAAILASVESVAAMEALFAMTRDYSITRHAFGRPIGSFQALKHLIADISLDVEAAKAICWAAVGVFRQDAAYLPEVANIAKAFTAERSAVVVQNCLQVHGGIGYAWEHDLHLYLRRIMGGIKMFGSAREHRRLIAEAHAKEWG